MGSTSIDDRTTKARVRDAAIQTVAEHGVAATTVRKVAAAAGVSPGLVIHHFGSMDGLRAACDEYVAAAIRQSKQRAISAGLELDVLAALRETQIGSLMGYLAAVLIDDSPAVARLVDDLVADAEVYLEQGVETGMLRPTTDPHGRAAVVILWSLGGLVMHRHLQRLLGADLTDPDAPVSATFGSYAGPAYEVLGAGVFTESFAKKLRDVFAETREEAGDGVAEARGGEGDAEE